MSTEKPKTGAKFDKRADALRANLMKRKQQNRGRTSTENKNEAKEKN